MDAQATGPMQSRRAGVLAHVSSLPGAGNSGNLGRASHRFLDWCASAGLRVWQILPLGPTGPGGCPYAATSAFAGNPALYAGDESRITSESAEDQADLGGAAAIAGRRLTRDWRRFRENAGAEERRAFECFRESPERDWLEDWSLYAALKERHGGRPWFEWDAALRRRDPDALRGASRELSESIAFHTWVQFAVDREARAVRTAAEQRDVVWTGDLPFYVALDSADVWSRRELFRVDEDGRPEAIAGAPPDALSDVGQLWDNPLFDWKAMADEGYAWWIARCRAALAWVHTLRVDHFRGYAAFWEIPADAETAAAGRWVPGPGADLFEACRTQSLLERFIAEDLGVIDDDVNRLRDAFGIPGMHVLQFGLDDPASTHHPSNHAANALACTGTHDTDTFNGWCATLDDAARGRVLETLGACSSPAAGAVEACWASPSGWSVAALQDLLELGTEARMNRPGVADGQWRWRCLAPLLDAALAARWREAAERHGRL